MERKGGLLPCLHTAKAKWQYCRTACSSLSWKEKHINGFKAFSSRFPQLSNISTSQNFEENYLKPGRREKSSVKSSQYCIFQSPVKHIFFHFVNTVTMFTAITLKGIAVFSFDMWTKALPYSGRTRKAYFNPLCKWHFVTNQSLNRKSVLWSTA